MLTFRRFHDVGYVPYRLAMSLHSILQGISKILWPKPVSYLTGLLPNSFKAEGV